MPACRAVSGERLGSLARLEQLEGFRIELHQAALYVGGVLRVSLRP